jgi:hypothetical protein
MGTKEEDLGFGVRGKDQKRKICHKTAPIVESSERNPEAGMVSRSTV